MTEQASVLGRLDRQAISNNRLPIEDRLKTLIRALADERQSRYGPDVGSPLGHVRTVFEEVVWGVDHVASRLERIRVAQAPVQVRGLLRQLEEDQRWLQGRLEVLNGLVGTLEAE